MYKQANKQTKKNTSKEKDQKPRSCVIQNTKSRYLHGTTSICFTYSSNISKILQALFKKFLIEAIFQQFSEQITSDVEFQIYFQKSSFVNFKGLWSPKLMQKVNLLLLT